MKSNLLTLIISLLISLVILEAGLRFFTPYPVSRISNKLHHEILGHVMDVNMKEIDEHGFRNETLQIIDIVALGDSHTYGFNVSSDNSWPKLLGHKTGKNVYNYGVGGYGILQYQYLLNKSIESSPDVVLLGIYLANDLNDICQRVLSKQYWISRAEDLHIDTSVCPETNNERHITRAVSNKNGWTAFKKWFVKNSAILCLFE